MPRIEPLPRADLPEFEPDFAMIDSMQGYVPNSLFTMARVPGLMPAFMTLVRTIFMNGLIPPDMVQMVALMASSGSGCRYCQAHTSKAAANLGVSADKLAAVWDFETSDLFTEAERAALRLAFHAGQVPNAATEEDFEACRSHYSEDQIAAIVASVALFGYLNRWNDTVATELEEIPHTFASDVLGPQGWERGKHVG
jgi:AhpD family alkylhydroperoxidase